MIGFPVSRNSNSANFSAFSSIKSASFNNLFPRSEGDIFCQSAELNAFLLEATILFTLSKSQHACCEITSPVAGLITSTISPPSISKTSPSIIDAILSIINSPCF